MSNSENYSIEILMYLKSQIEQTGEISNEDVLELINTCAILIIRNQDYLYKEIANKSNGTIEYRDRIYH